VVIFQPLPHMQLKHTFKDDPGNHYSLKYNRLQNAGQGSNLAHQHVQYYLKDPNFDHRPHLMKRRVPINSVEHPTILRTPTFSNHHHIYAQPLSVTKHPAVKNHDHNANQNKPVKTTSSSSSSSLDTTENETLEAMNARHIKEKEGKSGTELADIEKRHQQEKQLLEAKIANANSNNNNGNGNNGNENHGNNDNGSNPMLTMMMMSQMGTSMMGNGMGSGMPNPEASMLGEGALPSSELSGSADETSLSSTDGDGGDASSSLEDSTTSGTETSTETASGIDSTASNSKSTNHETNKTSNTQTDNGNGDSDTIASSKDSSAMNTIDPAGLPPTESNSSSNTNASMEKPDLGSRQ